MLVLDPNTDWPAFVAAVSAALRVSGIANAGNGGVLFIRDPAWRAVSIGGEVFDLTNDQWDALHIELRPLLLSGFARVAERLAPAMATMGDAFTKLAASLGPFAHALAHTPDLMDYLWKLPPASAQALQAEIVSSPAHAEDVIERWRSYEAQYGFTPDRILVQYAEP